MGKGVQQKIKCIFKTQVKEEQSEKRRFQTFSVLATDELREDADVQQAVPSEKVDGTCSFVSSFNGRPWLWARHDKKATKPAEKRFKRFKAQLMAWEGDRRQGDEPTFQWDLSTDFKATPENWIPALGVEKIDDVPQPDENGHTPGWVPVDPSTRTHCWHNSVVDFHTGIALILRMGDRGADTRQLELTVEPLANLLGMTLELVGTNINANPYGLGTKADPFHVLIPHGSIELPEVPPLMFEKLGAWFNSSADGRIEGIVWQCQDGELFKVHRHHLKLEWPITDTRLACLPVTVNVDLVPYEKDWDRRSLFYKMNQLTNRHFKHLKDLSLFTVASDSKS